MNGFAQLHGRPQRVVSTLATVLMLTMLATLLLLGTLQPGVQPGTPGREVPCFVLAAIQGEVDRTFPRRSRCPRTGSRCGRHRAEAMCA